MAFDMKEETLRHQNGWKGFVIFCTLGSIGVIVVLALMAATLL